jgi:hypothetical protein
MRYDAAMFDDSFYRPTYGSVDGGTSIDRLMRRCAPDDWQAGDGFGDRLTACRQTKASKRGR